MRRQAADAVKAIERALALEVKETHLEGDGEGLKIVSAGERKERIVWNELSAVSDGETFGSLELTSARARVLHRLGAYKHMEDKDVEAVGWYARAESKYNEVLQSGPQDIEAERTEAKTRKYASWLQVDWGMALENMGDFAAAVLRYEKGLAMRDSSQYGWVRQNRIPFCREKMEVSMTGERTREQRDSEGREAAIDLDAAPAKRSREALGRLEERVATARSVSTAAVEKRTRELIEPAFAEFMREEIDADELTRRRKAAREQAGGEDATLSALDRAYAKYLAAVEARVAAEASEAAADEELEAALRPYEGEVAAKRMRPSDGAGPSGVKAESVPKM